MLGIQHLGLFVASGLLLNVTPGQDTLYIVGRSVAQGSRAGLLSVAGIASGSVVHTLLVSFGLSAVLAASPTAFEVVKLAGAAYLVWLGAGMLLARRAPGGPGVLPSPARDWAIWRAGFLTNLLNPKVALFFLAFLPQFVAPAGAPRFVPFLVLGAIFVCNGTLWCLVLVWGAAAIGRRLRERPASGLLLRRGVGAVFMALGARLAAGS